MIVTGVAIIVFCLGIGRGRARSLPSTQAGKRTKLTMAFLTTTAVPLGRGGLARQCLARGSVRVTAIGNKRVAPVRAQPRMETDWTGPAPSSEVLGIAKDTSSNVLIGASVIALHIGVYCCYASNLASPLSAVSVNPLYVLGSLCLPISWGLHVAGWIQRQNNK